MCNLKEIKTRLWTLYMHTFSLVTLLGLVLCMHGFDSHPLSLCLCMDVYLIMFTSYNMFVYKFYHYGFIHDILHVYMDMHDNIILVYNQKRKSYFVWQKH